MGSTLVKGLAPHTQGAVSWCVVVVVGVVAVQLFSGDVTAIVEVVVGQAKLGASLGLEGTCDVLKWFIN